MICAGFAALCGQCVFLYHRTTRNNVRNLNLAFTENRWRPPSYKKMSWNMDQLPVNKLRLSMKTNLEFAKLIEDGPALANYSHEQLL